MGHQVQVLLKVVNPTSTCGYGLMTCHHWSISVNSWFTSKPKPMLDSQKIALLNPHRQKAAAEYFAWAWWLERKSLTVDAYVAGVLRRMGITLTNYGKQRLRQLGVEWDPTYAWGELDDDAVNPPFMLLQLFRNEIGLHYQYGHEDYASTLREVMASFNPRPDADRDWAELQRRRLDSHGELYQPETADYITLVTPGPAST
jgi:hypothetical protein